MKLWLQRKQLNKRGDLALKDGFEHLWLFHFLSFGIFSLKIDLQSTIAEQFDANERPELGDRFGLLDVNNARFGVRDDDRHRFVAVPGLHLDGGVGAVRILGGDLQIFQSAADFGQRNLDGAVEHDDAADHDRDDLLDEPVVVVPRALILWIGEKGVLEPSKVFFDVF